MKNKKEIETQIKGVLGNYKLLTLNNIAFYLEKVIQDDEEIKAFVFGVYENEKMNLLTTNKRVIIFKVGIIKSSQIEIPIEKINSIAQSRGFMSGEIHIWDSSSKISLTKVPINLIDNFVKATNEQINNYKSFKIEVNKTIEQDITDKIEKLAGLHKEGILTDYEFSTKKMELLEKLKK